MVGLSDQDGGETSWSGLYTAKWTPAACKYWSHWRPVGPPPSHPPPTTSSHPIIFQLISVIARTPVTLKHTWIYRENPYKLNLASVSLIQPRSQRTPLEMIMVQGLVSSICCHCILFHQFDVFNVLQQMGKHKDTFAHNNDSSFTEPSQSHTRQKHDLGIWWFFLQVCVKWQRVSWPLNDRDNLHALPPSCGRPMMMK